jgi:2-polyprenyl-3-methyl-5-hydroxy-6-metoxy-1,4-benzoquinol methylase
MEYDPIKRSLGNVFNRTPFLRKTFYNLLDLLLLRSWHVHQEIRRWAKGKESESLEILDAGAGFGQYTYYLSGFSPKWNITAIDVKEEQVADCNRFFGQIGRSDRVQFQVGDLVTYREENRYAFVLCVDVMEHVLEDVEVFTNYYHSLQPGGMLLISTPSDQGGSDVGEDHDESFIGEHVRDGYPIDEIQEKLRKAGFTKMEARYNYGTPGKISWRFSMKYPMQMLNTSKLFFILLPFYYLLFYPFCFVLNWMDVRGEHPTGTGLIVKAWK